MHLQRAASSVSDRAESIRALDAARSCAPGRLEVLVALYKFHFYQGNIEQARELIEETLTLAAEQGGFSADWSVLTPDAAAWHEPRGPGLVFVHSLKAMAFLNLRENDRSGAANVLGALRRLDPDNEVGADVIQYLLEGLQDVD